MHLFAQSERDLVLRHGYAESPRRHPHWRHPAMEVLYRTRRTHWLFGYGIHGAGEDALEPVMYLREVNAASAWGPAGIIAYSEVHPVRERNILQAAKRRGPHVRRSGALLGREDRPAPVVGEAGQVQVRTRMRVNRLMLGGSRIPGHNRAVSLYACLE